MKYTILTIVLILPLLTISCGSSPSYGDRLIAEGQSTRAIGQKWNKGESLVNEGEKQKKKGRKMIEDGEKLIEKGTKNIKRGEEMKDAIESNPSADPS